MKIGIVGAGMVGATAGYALVMSGIGREVVLVDKNRERAEAEANDIFHAVPFAHPLDVRAGDFVDLADSAIVIVAAGVGQKPGETRLQLLERNTAVFQAIVPPILQHAPDCIIVVATNPVDIMTHVTAHIAKQFGVPSSRIIGSGTTLDTARFRTLLSRRLGVDATHIHGYVVGEHGDSEVLLWSSTDVSNIPLHTFCEQQNIVLDEESIAQIDHNVRRAAYQIIEGKGATYYGIGSALVRICANILGNRKAIMTVCTPVDELLGVEDVTLALPFLVGGQGILKRLPLQMNEDEAAQLKQSAKIIRDAIVSLRLG